MRTIKGLFFTLLLLLPLWGASQSVLDGYIRQAIESNKAIQQRHVSLENAMLALKQAKYNYIPTLNFEGVYTTAEGGRSYEIPVGDYLNPLLETVNQFLGPNTVPTLENERINFLPKNYYDVKVRLAVPILNMDIINNNRIHERQKNISEKEVEIYARELVKEVKTTYYTYLSAKKAVEIHQSAIELAQESKRINEKLVENGTGVYAYVLRSDTEIEQAKAKKRAAELQLNSVQYFFNALLNRDLNSAIEGEDYIAETPSLSREETDVNKREEIHSLDEVIALREDVVNLRKQALVPTLSGFADFGSQAEKMKFNEESLYYMFGLQLNIPIFNGLKNNVHVKRAKNDIDLARLQKEEVAQQLSVAINAAYNEVWTEYTNYEAAIKQLEMAETYYRLISKGYDSGVNTYLETVDARTQLTMAKLATNVSYYHYLSAMAKLERETAKYPLPTFEN